MAQSESFGPLVHPPSLERRVLSVVGENDELLQSQFLHSREHGLGEDRHVRDRGGA